MTLAEISPPHTSEIAVAVVGTSFAAHIMDIWGWLPGVVATIGGTLAIVWYALMIAESKYVQSWLTRHAMRAKQRKIERLERKRNLIEAKSAAASARLDARRKVIEAQLNALGIMQVAETVATKAVETAKAEGTAQVASADKGVALAKGGVDANATKGS